MVVVDIIRKQIVRLPAGRFEVRSVHTNIRFPGLWELNYSNRKPGFRISREIASLHVAYWLARSFLF
jgi:hypothetical protein